MKVYSWNGEDMWEEDIEDVEQYILDTDGPGVYRIYEGVAHKPDIMRFVIGDNIIEDIANGLCGVYDEYSLDFCDKIEQDTTQFNLDLQYIFKQHMDRVGAKVNFYTVTDIKEIEIEVEE